MKEQKPKGKSQIPPSGPQVPDGEPSPLRRQDDDVDFEILDALEQIEQVGKGTGDGLSEDEDAIALNLDDEDLVFDDDEIPETEEFRFDDDLVTGLDSENQPGPQVAEEAEVLGLEQTFEEDEEEASPVDLAFDEDIDLPFDEKFDVAALDLDISEETSEDDEVLDFGDGVSEMMSEATLPEELSPAETSDAAWEETEKSLDEVNFEELPEMEESFEFESQIDDESGASPEKTDMPTEKDVVVFPGKAVIAVDDDQVIDLGDEHDLEEATPDELAAFSEDTAIDQETEMDLAGLEADAQKILSNIVAGQTVPEETEAPEQEPVEGVKAEEQFMASLEDVDIDLEEDVVDMFEASEEEREMDIAEPMPEAAEEPGNLTVPVLDETITELQAQSLEAELREEGLAAIDSDLLFPEGSFPVSEEDQLKALGLVPRLTDAEVEKFEHLVTEAKTLEFYAEKLTIHQSEITPRIYQKLSKEYLSRKTEIFREPEFISICIDVEQDLQDMLGKRSDFTTTIARLNEELEEVKVRNLVGEYTDAMLAEKQRTQQADILEWQQKLDALGTFIERYQELLDTAHVLNPLEEETIAEEVKSAVSAELPPEMEPEETIGAEETFLEEPSLDELAESVPSEEELAADESLADVLAELPSLPEEETDVTAETVRPDEFEAEAIGASDVITEDLDKEMEDLETLTSIFDEEDSSEWEAEAEEDTELSPEDFDEQEFSLETGTEEDFEIESFSELEAEEVEEEASTPEPTIICKKCGRATPAAEKFCVNCGAKAR